MHFCFCYSLLLSKLLIHMKEHIISLPFTILSALNSSMLKSLFIVSSAITLLTYSLTHSLHDAGYYLKSCYSACQKNPVFLWNSKVHHRVHTRSFGTFRNKQIFTVRVVSPTPNPKAGGPPLAGCPWLLIQYIRSYPPYPEDFPLPATWGRAMPWWQGTHLTWSLYSLVIFTFSLNVWTDIFICYIIWPYASSGCIFCHLQWLIVCIMNTELLTIWGG
jgi:hypothetical protein